MGATAGPPGPAVQGLKGDPGPNGHDAFSVLAIAFTVPPAGLTGNLQLEDALWVAEGQWVALADAGDYQVQHKGSNNVLIVYNPGYPGNAAEGTVWGLGQRVSPSGQQGAPGKDFVLTSPLVISLGGTGQGTAQLAFDALSPLASRGQVIGFDGNHNIYVAAGNDGDVLFADSTAVGGFRFGVPSHTTIPFDSIAPGSTKGDLLVRTATGYTNLPVSGFAGSILTADPNAATGVSWQGVPSPSLVRTVLTAASNNLTGLEQFVAVQPFNFLAPLVINLPLAVLMGNRTITIKDESGNAGAQPIVIQPVDTSLIQGSASFSIDVPYGRVTVYYNGSQFCLL